MNPITQFVARQSAWLALFFLLFAVLNGAYVCEGLWQGVGLHGYIIEPGAKGGPPHVVSVWSAMFGMLTFLGLAGLCGMVALRNGDIRLGSGTITIRTGKAKVMETPGSKNSLPRSRKQAKRH